MEKILVIKTGFLPKETITKLEEKDIVIIECSDPSKIKTLSFINSIDMLSADDIFMAAMYAANSDMSSKKLFAENILKACRGKNLPAPPEPPITKEDTTTKQGE